MRLLKWIVILPVAAVLVAFAFANRAMVTINLDPLDGGVLPTLAAPQFLVILIAAAIGVIAGSLATWLGQGRNRRRARLAEAEVERLRYEVQAGRTALGPAPTSSLIKQA